MTVPTAGWYADPTGGPGLRYWNGTSWTDSTQPAPSLAPSYPATSSASSGPYGQAAGGYPGGTYPGGTYPAGPTPNYQHPPAPAPAGGAAGLWAQNRMAFVTVIIGVVYLAIAGFSHFVFFGILPVLYTVRSFQAKEPLAWLAAAVTVATIAFSFWRYSH